MAATRSITCGADSVGLAIVPPPAGYGNPLLPTISLVIPTRHEAGNVQELITRIGRATTGISAEITFVDDSDDNTPEAIRDVSGRSRLTVSLIHRPPEDRRNGLGGAVLNGMRAARGQWVCVMDADLQHPPELIPQLLKTADDEGADIVVASRYTDSGEVPGLGSIRLAMSRLSSFAGRLCFPGRIRNVRDSLSGFFLVRRGAIDPNILRPRGFKILFEILVRFPDLSVAEVPFCFATRHSGESKMSVREGLRYVTLLLNLRLRGHF